MHYTISMKNSFYPKSFKIRNPKRCDRSPNPLKSILPSFLKRKSNEKSQTNVGADGVASAAIWTRVQSSWSALPFPLQYRGLFGCYVYSIVTFSSFALMVVWWMAAACSSIRIRYRHNSRLESNRMSEPILQKPNSIWRFVRFWMYLSDIDVLYMDIYFLCAQTRKLNVIYRHTHTHWLCDSASKDDIR